MNDFTPIYEALQRNDLESARELLRPILQTQPDSAEAWYLAAQAAKNASQQRHFLEKAIELDPLHAKAANALHALDHPKPRTPAPSAAPRNSRFRLAPLNRRATAFVIDQAALSMISFILLLWLPLPENAQPTDSTTQSLAAIWLLTISLLHITYHMIFVLRTGQTPGKQFSKLKIVRRDGNPLTAWDIFLRCYVGYLFSTFAFGMGFVWATNNPLQQAWHDLVADTLVVEV
ncbi:MAG: RDD family protein [Anaerolineae bacterium]|nr:RDD family protein [Anaerolineae bacterium]